MQAVLSSSPNMAIEAMFEVEPQLHVLAERAGRAGLAKNKWEFYSKLKREASQYVGMYAEKDILRSALMYEAYLQHLADVMGI